MVTQSFRDAVYPQETGEDFILLLLIEHADLDAPVRLTNGAGTVNADGTVWTLSALGKTWICAGMVVELPEQSEKTPRARITVPNVDSSIGEALDGISTPATCTIWAVLASSPSTIVGGPHSYLKLVNTRGNALTVTGDLTRTQYTREPWPKEWISPSKFWAAYYIGGY